jgi:uncharacterized protein YaaQ
MKLIIAIVKEADQNTVSQSLIDEEFKVTLIASSGGFLKRGLATLLIGVADEKLGQAMTLIRSAVAGSSEPEGKRATIFVVNVLNFTHF